MAEKIREKEYFLKKLRILPQILEAFSDKYAHTLCFLIVGDLDIKFPGKEKIKGCLFFGTFFLFYHKLSFKVTFLLMVLLRSRKTSSKPSKC